MNQKSTINLDGFHWINKPQKFDLHQDKLMIVTDPQTDFWQCTYYGFQNDNAHAFVRKIEGDFTLIVKTEFDTKTQYDQCGIILYQDSENWAKASVEYEDQDIARLGSVVTNLGYSDWASTDIPSVIDVIWYRLSRRGQDFYIEFSQNGKYFQQMRMFHMHDTIFVAQIGVYACSPLKASFKAVFSGFELSECKWPEYKQH